MNFLIGYNIAVQSQIKLFTKDSVSLDNYRTSLMKKQFIKYVTIALEVDLHVNLRFSNLLSLECLPVWRDRVRRLAADPLVMRSSPATRHIRYALLNNQHK